MLGTEVRDVEVNGRAGYWISGEQHLFFTYDRDGMQQEQRLAGNTLVWQEGDEIVRVEGVDLTLEEARRSRGANCGIAVLNGSTDGAG